VCLSSDAFLPFRDNVDRAARSNVRYVAQAGGSNRDDEVTAAADSYDMVMIHTGMRWFLH
jgi:phosphoribosylaminoimidazolecarboxamide formyltransferase/IMP cyclohydrolase/phosphoribosylaminoimidazolecarboxamide formyltransferase